MELTEGHKSSTASASLGAPTATTTTSTVTSTGCKSSTASASLGAPTEMTTKSTMMSTVSSAGAEGTTTVTVSSTTEGEMVDLEEAMMRQGMTMMKHMARNIKQCLRTGQTEVR